MALLLRLSYQLAAIGSGGFSVLHALDDLLLEDGFALLLEDGTSTLVLE